MTIDEAITHAREVAEKTKKQGCELCAQEHEQLAKWLEELKRYRTIGTPEECRAAMEQKAKKVIEKYKAKAPEDIEAYGEDAVFGYCPVCGNLQNNVWNTKYCGDCGQKLDWRDEE